MAFADKVLVCRDCGREFTFTAGEQEFYQAKGLVNEPTRCRDCRASRRTGRGESGERPPRTMYTVVCASCGGDALVPFQPRDNRPVYCSDCFAKQREAR